MTKKLFGLLAMASLLIPAWGCGAPTAQEMDEAAIQEHLSRHEHVVSSSSIVVSEGEGNVCYCSVCAKHHAPECL
ncbi:hypothetical protein OWM54_25470 [Myxococcus sp. MISCRS1]|uniref:hypothetical protein n=1 Tax=Myxococcus sp. MISCRS1 TaxID=2996786 RepID=UPI00227179AF|nr:hypothetical protein [Myxococcus sp. MISCRS1]MCY1000498.1 hypothetical protein [Myxococcus sp. MISCRS1]BDT37958.1 hypothetical protein MFMH1_76270 [Myxococcus sp. MH1]